MATIQWATKLAPYIKYNGNNQQDIIEQVQQYMGITVTNYNNAANTLFLTDNTSGLMWSIPTGYYFGVLTGEIIDPTTWNAQYK